MTTTPPTRIGKTTVAASVGTIFVQLRQDGRVAQLIIPSYGSVTVPITGKDRHRDVTRTSAAALLSTQHTLVSPDFCR